MSETRVIANNSNFEALKFNKSIYNIDEKIEKLTYNWNLERIFFLKIETRFSQNISESKTTKV
jgi:hypothetical protein